MKKTMIFLSLLAMVSYSKEVNTSISVYLLLDFVGRLGFEPGMTEPKPVVLPLHHRPIAIKRVQRYEDFSDSPNI